jgi:hypothetical protein
MPMVLPGEVLTGSEIAIAGTLARESPAPGAKPSRCRRPSHEDVCENLVTRAFDEFGKLDIFVHNPPVQMSREST